MWTTNLTYSGAVFAVVVGVVMLAGVMALVRWSLRFLREAREIKILGAARRDAQLANQNVTRGLQKMAAIVPDVGDSRVALAARAMDLLDSQSAMLMALRRSRNKPSFRRRRARLELARQFREIAGLDRTFESFQQAMLTAVCEHAARRVVPPPVAEQRYQAMFTVLAHQLPVALWPAMNQILEKHVQLWARPTSGDWTQALGVGFRCGRELLFSRKVLETAVELRLVVGERIVSEFTVEHERQATPRRRWFTPLFPRLRSGHRLFHRPSRPKQIPSNTILNSFARTLRRGIPARVDKGGLVAASLSSAGGGGR